MCYRVLHLKRLLLLSATLWLAVVACAQVELPQPVKDSSDYGLLLMKEQRKKWGPNDSIMVPAIVYHGEITNYK